MWLIGNWLSLVFVFVFFFASYYLCACFVEWGNRRMWISLIYLYDIFREKAYMPTYLYDKRSAIFSFIWKKQIAHISRDGYLLQWNCINMVSFSPQKYMNNFSSYQMQIYSNCAIIIRYLLQTRKNQIINMNYLIACSLLNFRAKLNCVLERRREREMMRKNWANVVTLLQSTRN